MKKYAICFSLYVDERKWPEWLTLYSRNTLGELSEFHKNGNFDTYFFYSGPERYLDEIKESNSWVNFVRFDYDPAKYLNDPKFHKWTNVLTFADKQYDSVLLLDTDIRFNRDPSYIFEKYTQDAMHVVYDRYVELDDLPILNWDKKPIVYNNKILDYNDIIGYKGINSGQILFSKNSLAKVKHDFENQALAEWNHIENKIDELINKKVLPEDIHKKTIWITEQFAGQSVFLKHGVELIEFDRVNDIDYSIYPGNCKATVVHYISGINALKVMKYGVVQQHMQKHRAIYFSLLIDKNSSLEKKKFRLMQLHYALETLSRFKDFQTMLFDVHVFMSCEEEFITHTLDLYPWVKVVPFMHDNSKFAYNLTYHKWENLLWYADKNYNSILYLDIDVRFNSNPSGIFDKYKSENSIHTHWDNCMAPTGKPQIVNENGDPVIYEGKVLDFNTIIGFKGMNSGQMLFTRDIILKIKDTLMDDIHKNFLLFENKVEELIQAGYMQPNSHTFTSHTIEQFAGQKALMDHGIKIEIFEEKDIKIDLNYEDPFTSTITHYISLVNTHLAIPEYFRKRYLSTSPNLIIPEYFNYRESNKL